MWIVITLCHLGDKEKEKSLYMSSRCCFLNIFHSRFIDSVDVELTNMEVN
jgi:hypothetical protein